jgi:hypothetical protein
VTSYNQTFGPNSLLPQAIMSAPFVKLSVQVDWEEPMGTPVF